MYIFGIDNTHKSVFTTFKFKTILGWNIFFLNLNENETIISVGNYSGLKKCFKIILKN